MWYSSDCWITRCTLRFSQYELQKSFEPAEELDAVGARHRKGKSCYQWLGGDQLPGCNWCFLRFVSELLVYANPGSFKFSLSFIKVKAGLFPPPPNHQL